MVMCDRTRRIIVFSDGTNNQWYTIWESISNKKLTIFNTVMP